MHKSVPVVILGVFCDTCFSLFLHFFFYSPLNVSLNQNKIIKRSFRDTLCFVVHDENRKSEHLGGTHCFVSGF